MILPLRSQSEFITEGDRLLVDRLFPLDARKGFSPSLMAFLGVEAIPHLNGSPPLSAAKLSSAAEQRIGEMYARDFALWHQVTKSGNDLLLR